MGVSLIQEWMLDLRNGGFRFLFLSLFGFAVSVSDLVWIASALVGGCWWLLLC
jgi:hypothetical protein